MKTVLVTQRLIRHLEYPEERDALDVRWALFLRKAELLPVLIPSTVDVEAFISVMGNVAGLLLTGGNDLGVVADDPLSRRRDALEATLCAIMEARCLPILGVCRGLQFLAHRYGSVIKDVPGHAGTRHWLQVQPGSRWLKGHTGSEVNSYHSFGPMGGQGPLRIAAVAPDGAIEAVEHPDRPVLGIMWHPERETPFREADVALFEEFYR